MYIRTKLKRYFSKLQELFLLPILYENYLQIFKLFFFKTRQKIVYLKFRHGPLLGTWAQHLHWKHNGLRVISEIWVRDEYTPAILQLSPPSTIVDVGAHVGTFTLFCIKNYPHAKVFAIEPETNNFKLLKNNVILNNSKNVQLFNIAISNAKKNLKLYLSDSTFAHSLIVKSEHSVKIRAITLDQLFDQNKIASCGLLKVDIEGAEYKLFQGLSDENLKKIKSLAMEYQNSGQKGFGNIQKIIKRLKTCGFKTLLKSSTTKEYGHLYAYHP